MISHLQSLYQRAAFGGALAVAFLIFAACLPAEESSAPTVDRLLGSFDAEPLLALCVSDARALPQQLNRANLLKMLQDTSYAQGMQTINALLIDALGADFRALWPDISQLLSGPAVLTLSPPLGDAADARDPWRWRLTLSVLTPSAEKAKKLRELLPPAPPQTNTLLSILELQTILPDALPSAEKMPDWAKSDQLPKSALILRARPQKLLEQLKRLKKISANDEDENEEASPWINFVMEMITPDTDLLLFGLALNGEMFTEELILDMAPEKDTAFTRVVNVAREQVESWDSLQQALPGEQDVIALGQADLKALKDDLPCATQALERYLRGRRWARSKGCSLEALAPTRFDFLLNRLQGNFGIVGTPAISGNMHITVAAAMKNNEIDLARDELLKGLKNVGADFVALEKARRIGGSAPLGAKFQGRGLFNAPIIGIDSGWAWLCSNLATYQSLAAAFKTGKTLKADVDCNQSKIKEFDEKWQDSDALRLQINLERVIKLIYALWVLSAEDGPFLGAWKAPSDLLPQPSVFNNRVGMLRAGLSRQKNRLKIYAHGVFPGMSFLLVSLLQNAASQIQRSRQLSREAQDIETLKP